MSKLTTLDLYLLLEVYTMNNQAKLQVLLEELLGSRNVYYQTPETLKMKYPAIKYSLDTITSTHANNAKYTMRDRYQLTVISKSPDHEVIKKLLSLPYSSYERHYVADNLNHDVINIYY